MTAPLVAPMPTVIPSSLEPGRGTAARVAVTSNSPMISPITLANLKPCPQQTDATRIRLSVGSQSTRK